jgi:Ca-activated chloride channel family protein
MNVQKISPDDPRLTAYALGELAGDERAEIEAALAADPALRAAVEDVRALAAQLEGALAKEQDAVVPFPILSEAPKTVLAKAAGPAGKPPAREKDPYAKKVTRFPYVLIGSLAAACFAVMFVQYQRSRVTELAQYKLEADAARKEALNRARYSAETSMKAKEPHYAFGGSPSGASIFLVKDAEEFARLPRMEAPTLGMAQPGAVDVFNTESYAFVPENDFFRVRSAPLSTFSIDVDTASYANVRRFLTEGRRPPRDAVRIEEMVNYFNYRYAPPAKETAEPFAASMEIAAAPWNPAHRLVRIGLKGREVAMSERPAANLVFLLDVSGSMSDENKLPLVKESLRLLLEKLRADDRVAIVTYAGASGLALPSTPASKKSEILGALEELRPGGSTNGAMGIQLAYDIAKANFIAGGANRVILCTDGDFNVGVTGDGDLTRLIEDKAKSGVFLTVLGFGMGNFKDGTLERLADKGNGNYGYIDSRAEANKLLVEQAGATLVTIAKDVKLQVEFNPAVAQAYRLIGYENRVLKKEDFNNDKVDAGEIGAGHTVTALYEIVPVGAPAPASLAPAEDPLKYQSTAPASAVAEVGKAAEAVDDEIRPLRRRVDPEELLTLKIRFKEPTVEISRKMEIPVVDVGTGFDDASKDFKFAAAVASLGMMLRESAHLGTADYDRVISWAEAGKGEDADGRRTEFIELAKKARALTAE